MRALCILTGPPGAGKTTVAEQSLMGSGREVHITADAFWHFIVDAIDPWLPASAEQNTVVVDAVVAASIQFLEGGYATVVDGVIGPWFLEPFVAAARAVGAEIDYVVLRPSEEVAFRRATGRHPEALRDEEPIREMYRKFSELGRFERHVIDSSTMTVAETAEAIRAGLGSGAFRL